MIRHYFKEVLLCHIQEEGEVTQEGVIQVVILAVAEAIREAAEVRIAILILHSQEATLLSYTAAQEDRGLCILITRIILKK